MKKCTSVISMMLVIGGVFQHSPIWADLPQQEQSTEVRTETIVKATIDEEALASLNEQQEMRMGDEELSQCCAPLCDPCSPQCYDPCPPSCAPCPPRCEPCPPVCAPCPPPCDPCPPCPPPCDPCAPVCKRNSGVSIWAIGLALLAVGGAAAIVATSNNGS